MVLSLLWPSRTAWSRPTRRPNPVPPILPAAQASRPVTSTSIKLFPAWRRQSRSAHPATLWLNSNPVCPPHIPPLGWSLLEAFRSGKTYFVHESALIKSKVIMCTLMLFQTHMLLFFCKHKKENFRRIWEKKNNNNYFVAHFSFVEFYFSSVLLNIKVQWQQCLITVAYK